MILFEFIKTKTKFQSIYNANKLYKPTLDQIYVIHLYFKYDFSQKNAKCKIMHLNINKPHNPKTSKLETKTIFCDQINLN
jgi:hypothetical protein